MKAIVTFACGKNERPPEVQLEPEALLISVLPDNKISFVAEKDAGEVAWAVLLGRKPHSGNASRPSAI